jgi:hypothetical protein
MDVCIICGAKPCDDDVCIILAIYVYFASIINNIINCIKGGGERERERNRCFS